jgi:RNA polymerase sigma-70 factor (ECF subfamily)
MDPFATIEPSDDALVSRAQTGDDAAFGVLMERHNRSVYRVVRGVLRDGAAAEEVMQDAYVKAFTHLSELGAGGAFSTWVRKIAFREALGHWRHSRSSPFADEELESLEVASLLPNPEQETSRAELRRALEKAVDLLPDGYREVFMLRSVEGCSVRETAALLGVQEDTVKTRQFRARVKLQAMLSGWADQDASHAFAFPDPRGHRVSARVLDRLKFN